MWKKILLGIVIIIIIAISLALYFNKSLSEVADKQLAALRAGNVAVAYAYVSNAFRDNTSLEEFEKFVDKYPALKNNKSVSWSEREITGITGTLKGTLSSSDGTTTPIEFHFLKENNEWRVLSILVLKFGAQEKSITATSNTVKHDESLGKIQQVLVSEAQTASGEVDKGKAVLRTPVPTIFVSTYILGAKKGLIVTASLIYSKTDAVVAGPLKAKVTQDGDVVRNFFFTNVDATKVWPVGDYRVDVTTSNGQAAKVNFKIK